MASFSDFAKIAQAYDFQSRVAYALEVAALAVYNEVVDGTVITQAQHILRAAFARQVLSGTFPIGSATIFAIALGVLTNATVAAEANLTAVNNNIPDSDIQFQINSMWNALAGA